MRFRNSEWKMKLGKKLSYKYGGMTVNGFQARISQQPEQASPLANKDANFESMRWEYEQALENEKQKIVGFYY